MHSTLHDVAAVGMPQRKFQNPKAQFVHVTTPMAAIMLSTDRFPIPVPDSGCPTAFASGVLNRLVIADRSSFTNDSTVVLCVNVAESSAALLVINKGDVSSLVFSAFF